MTTYSFTLQQRYEVVGQHLESFAGRLLDVGSRDRILTRALGPAATYESADTGEGHDVKIDLEQPLTIAPRSYDAVVALDVLEHVERIHDAFRGLASIADETLIIALPNIAVWTRRWLFLRKGNIGGKYALLPDHQGDRHRWVTIYPEMVRFIEAQAAAAGFEVVEQCDEVVVTRRPLRWLANAVISTRGPRGGALIERSTFFMRRIPASSATP